MKNGTIDEISLIKLLIIRSIFKIVFKKLENYQSKFVASLAKPSRRVHWPCAVAYAVEGFFLYFPCMIQKQKMKPPEATEPKSEKIT